MQDEATMRYTNASGQQAVTPDTYEGIVEMALEDMRLAGVAAGVPRATARKAGSLAPMLARALGVSMPAEAMTTKQREDANIKAMELMLRKSRAEMTPQDLYTLSLYSGWGGLSLERNEDRFPEGSPVPSSRGLINEYYTPERITRAVVEQITPLVGTLPQVGGKTLALEPAAGIGRFMDAARGLDLDWHAVELMELSHEVLARRFGQHNLFKGYFGQWIARHGAEVDGKLGLVLANPPYGPRSGVGKNSDRNPDYDRGPMSKAAAPYFMRRALDLLAPGGLGVFLVPAGIMLSPTQKRGLLEYRRELLRRHHLLAAYRLPSRTFPGAQLVTDLLIFEARDGILPAPTLEDEAIIDGGYYRQFPDHILGVEVGPADDEISHDRRSRYRVEGEFSDLPALTMRPMRTIPGATPRPRTTTGAAKPQSQDQMGVAPEPKLDGLDGAVSAAVSLGRRTGNYLRSLATEDTQVAQGRFARWRTLRYDLLAWTQSHGNPHKNKALLRAQSEHPGAQRFLAAFDKQGDLIDALSEAPAPWAPPFQQSKTVAGVLRHIWYKTSKPIGLDALADGVVKHLGASDKKAALKTIGEQFADFVQEFPADWNGALEFVPKDHYFTGELWPRLDRAVSALQQGRSAPIGKTGVIAMRDAWRRQAEDLEIAIEPVTLEEIEPDPTVSWVPVEVLNQWGMRIFEVSQPIFERRHGLLTAIGVPYEGLQQALGKGRSEHASTCTLKAKHTKTVKRIIGWVNGDSSLLRFTSDKDNSGNIIVSADDKRKSFIDEYTKSFVRFLLDHEEARAKVEELYNRTWRGYVAPSYKEDTLFIDGWASRYTPHGYQNAGARRLLANNGGVLAFDVGLGKTITGLMTYGKAKEQGRANRPIFLVPNSLAIKWERDIKEAYPSAAVGIIGLQRKTDKLGNVTIATDTPAQRGRKWLAFMAGQYDVIVLTYSSMPRTEVDAAALAEFVSQKVSVLSEVIKAGRNKGKRGGMSERDQAVLEQSVELWISDKVRIRPGWEYDQGVTWQDIGCDFLIIDEGQNFKNLYFPPKAIQFMGQGESSSRAWQLLLRSLNVRSKGGFVGVLSATPAKNSPLEFYNIMEIAGPQYFGQYGVAHPWQFISRYIKIEPRTVPKADGTLDRTDAAVGFKNVHELRLVLGRFAEFKTAEDVNLPLPDVDVKIIEIEMSDRQRAIHDGLAADYRNGDNNDLLGVLVRMVQTCIHPALGAEPKRWKWKNAMELVHEGQHASPKFLRLAQEIATDRGCGHIVFVENLAAHRWIYHTLVDAGFEASRITFLNAEHAPTPDDRQRIADDFNGDAARGIEPKYDIIICNQVAYEGVDLQVRTCGIHHMDIPWEFATLQQRNGRAVRQGNEVGEVSIKYYVHSESVEAVKLSKIDGKRNWLVDLLRSQDRETNSPYAGGDSDGSTDMEILKLIYGDNDAAMAVYAKNRALVEIVQDERAAAEAANTFRALARKAIGAKRIEATKPRRAQVMRDGIAAELKILAKLPDHIWPWSKVHEGILGDEPGSFHAEAMHLLPSFDDEPGRLKFGMVWRKFRGAGVQRQVGTTGDPLIWRGGRLPTTMQAFGYSWIDEEFMNRKLKDQLDTARSADGLDPVQWRKWQLGVGEHFASSINRDVDPSLQMTPEEFRGQIKQKTSRLVYLTWHRADAKWLDHMWRTQGQTLNQIWQDGGFNAGRHEHDKAIPIIRQGQLAFDQRGTSGDQLFEPGDNGWAKFISMLPGSSWTYKMLTDELKSDAIKAWFGPRRLYKRHFETPRPEPKPAPEPPRAAAKPIAEQRPPTALQSPVKAPAPSDKAVQPKAGLTKADVQGQLLALMGQIQTIRERIANAIEVGKAQSGIDVYKEGLNALQERAKALKAQAANAQ